MKAAVAYYSVSGHSRKIAMAIADRLNLPIYNFKDHPEFGKLDLLFIVGGIYGNKSKPRLVVDVKYIYPENIKKVALITSCLNTSNRQYRIREELEKNGVEVVKEEYVCQGSYVFFKMGHPDEEEINNAVEFASKVISGEIK